MLVPNRIIKDTICTNEQIDRLTPFEETMFYRLIVNADDFGRFDGRPAILKARLFPLKDLRLREVEEALSKLAAVELVEIYEVDGRPLVSLPKWELHQKLRSRRARYPAPPCDGSYPQGKSGKDSYPQSVCNLLQVDNSLQQVVARNQYESEYESESESERESERDAREVRSVGRLVGYIDANISPLTAGNYAELNELMGEGITEDMVIYAIDLASERRARTWAYVKSILRAWASAGIKSVGDAKAEAEARRSKFAKDKAPAKAGQNYAQREITDDDFASGFYVDVMSRGRTAP